MSRAELNNLSSFTVPLQILKFAKSEHAAQFIIDGLTRLGLKIKPLDEFDAEHHFVGAGRLYYGNNETETLRVDISAEEEEKLLSDRLFDLVKPSHLKDWAEHHHLAGTTAETRAGKEGNYTALVSNFALKKG